MAYLLQTIDNNVKLVFCRDRLWRIYRPELLEDKKKTPIVYTKPNNAVTMGKRLVARDFIDVYEVIPLPA